METTYYYNRLPPVVPDVERPLWSVMIPTFNCASYAAETIKSVLLQDPGPAIMQIEVIDDGSTDNIEDVVKEVGQGRVGFYKQMTNKGHIANFETALRRSKGFLVHILHGDDRVLWGFYEQMGKLLNSCPSAGAAFCRHYFIDEYGDQNYISPLEQFTSSIMPNFLVSEAKENIVQTASMVVRRKVYEELGMFRHGLIHSEDWEMWVRIACHYPIAYLKQPLAEYRNYQKSNTIRSALHPNGWQVQLKVLDMIYRHAQAQVPDLRRAHYDYLSRIGWYQIRHFYNAGYRKEAISWLKKLITQPLSLTQKLSLLKETARCELRMRYTR